MVRTSRSYSSSYSSQTAPLGIKVICVLGAVGAIDTLLGGLAVFSIDSSFAILGLALLVIGTVQLVVVYGLWTLESWAWTVAIFVYALRALIAAGRIQFLSMIISLLVAAYIASKADYYR